MFGAEAADSRVGFRSPHFLCFIKEGLRVPKFTSLDRMLGFFI